MCCQGVLIGTGFIKLRATGICESRTNRQQVPNRNSSVY